MENKKKDSIWILIRKIDRWSIICEEIFVTIKKGNDVLRLFQIRKEKVKFHGWMIWPVLFVCDEETTGGQEQCISSMLFDITTTESKQTQATAYNYAEYKGMGALTHGERWLFNIVLSDT